MAEIADKEQWRKWFDRRVISKSARSWDEALYNSRVWCLITLPKVRKKFEAVASANKPQEVYSEFVKEILRP